MKQEKEIQDELEKYWGQMDRVEKMLKWLVMENLICDKSVDDKTHAKAMLNQPDISDILDEENERD